MRLYLFCLHLHEEGGEAVVGDGREEEAEEGDDVGLQGDQE